MEDDRRHFTTTSHAGRSR